MKPTPSHMRPPIERVNFRLIAKATPMTLNDLLKLADNLDTPLLLLREDDDGRSSWMALHELKLSSKSRKGFIVLEQADDGYGRRA